MRTKFLTRAVRLLAGAGLGILAACAGNDTVAPAPNQAREAVPAATRAVPGRYVVLMKRGQEQAVTAAAAVVGPKAVRTFTDIGVATMKDLTSSEVASLQAASGVEAVVPDLDVEWIPGAAELFHQAALPAPQGPRAQGTDQSGAAFFAFQWNMGVIHAQTAWNATPGGAGELVCILDTGIDPDHLDLAGKVDLNRSTSVISAPLFPGDLEVIDYNSHGSFVAGLVSSNGIGVASVAPDAQLCAVKVLKVDGFGSFGDIISGIDFAVHNGADVINMSLSGYVDRTAPGAETLIKALQAAVDFANAHSVLVVASAGNAGLNLDEDPVQFLNIPNQLNNVMSIGATAPFNQQNFDMLASYSNYGGRTGLDMVAPGGDLLAGGNTFDLVLSVCSQYQLTLPFPCGSADYLLGAGTSFSSPEVAGAAAVVESQLGSPQGSGIIANCLLNTADNVGPRRIFGAGRLNVGNAAGC